jgi:hypothetical protein
MNTLASPSSLVPFDFEGRQIRGLTDEQGEPWFVAADVCHGLGIGNPRQAMTRLDKDTNQNLAACGLQILNPRGEWELTHAGLQCTEALPYCRGGHSGYQILWNPAVVDVVRELG